MGVDFLGCAILLFADVVAEIAGKAVVSWARSCLEKKCTLAAVGKAGPDCMSEGTSLGVLEVRDRIFPYLRKLSGRSVVVPRARVGVFLALEPLASRAEQDGLVVLVL